MCISPYFRLSRFGMAGLRVQRVSQERARTVRRA
jgi:hypothetical protein